MITRSFKEIRQQKEHWGWRLEVKEGGGRAKSEKEGVGKKVRSSKNMGSGTVCQLWYKYHKIYVNIYK